MIDFGVPSAAGRYLADIRVNRFGLICPEILSWARLQLVLFYIGFLPMLIIAYFVIHTSNFEIPSRLLNVVLLTVVFNVIINFCRPCLTSLLAFKYLSVLDAYSVTRSFLQLLAALFVPSAFGLALAALITSLVGAALASSFLILYIQRQFPVSTQNFSSLYKHVCVYTVQSCLFVATCSNKTLSRNPFLGDW